MNDNNTNVLLGLKHNTYYFYSICAVIGIQIINNVINIKYLDDVKNVTNNVTKSISDQGKNISDFGTILKETSDQSLVLQQKYQTQVTITYLLSVIAFALTIAAIVFLSKTVLNYYGTFAKSKEGKTLVTTSGAAWGWFIPFLNFVRPFNTTNEVLNSSPSATKDPQVATAQYAVWTSFALSLINSIFASLTPTILMVILSAVSGLLFLYASYNMFNVHKRIFQMQNN